MSTKLLCALLCQILLLDKTMSQIKLTNECHTDADCNESQCCVQILAGVGECHLLTATEQECRPLPPWRRNLPRDRATHNTRCPCAAGLTCAVTSSDGAQWHCLPRTSRTALVHDLTDYIFCLYVTSARQQSRHPVTIPDYCVDILAARY